MGIRRGHAPVRFADQSAFAFTAIGFPACSAIPGYTAILSLFLNILGEASNSRIFCLWRGYLEKAKAASVNDREKAKAASLNDRKKAEGLGSILVTSDRAAHV